MWSVDGCKSLQHHPRTERGIGWEAEKHFVGRAGRGEKGGPATRTPSPTRVTAMVRHMAVGFKLERTEKPVTAHGGLALLVKFNHGLRGKKQ